MCQKTDMMTPQMEELSSEWGIDAFISEIEILQSRG